MDRELIINGVVYVKKETHNHDALTMNSWVYCNICGAGMVLSSGYARRIHILKGASWYDVRVCLSCKDTWGLT